MKALLMREGDRIRVFAPYSPDFVAELKENVPYHAKSWDGDSKNWLVDEDYEDPLIEVASTYFDVSIVVSEDEARRRERAAKAATTPNDTSRPAHNAQQCLSEVKRLWREETDLFLIPGAPWPVVQAVYRSVAKLFHPDIAGPSGAARMVAANKAYELLEKRSRRASA